MRSVLTRDRRGDARKTTRKSEAGARERGEAAISRGRPTATGSWGRRSNAHPRSRQRGATFGLGFAAITVKIRVSVSSCWVLLSCHSRSGKPGQQVAGKLQRGWGSEARGGAAGEVRLRQWKFHPPGSRHPHTL